MSKVTSDATPAVSVIVPTYEEVLNIPHVIERVAALRDAHDLDLELIFMDDRSRDGSAEAVAAASQDWVEFVERDGPRGLSAAVIDGFKRARGDVLICMDADLSHPPEIIPQMLTALQAGYQMMVGSRYVAGGSTDDDWGFGRWLNSRIATILARPLTSIKDPMSGFFAMRQSDFKAAKDLNPIGYKIALELIVKCDLQNIGELPIAFKDRVHGESKLSLSEQLKYIQHIRRLYIHQFADTMHVLQFLVVGASGVVVNLLILGLLLNAGVPKAFSLAGGIAVSLITNFLLNRRFTFSYARSRNIWMQFAGFLVASAVGMTVNYTVALYMATSVLPQGGLMIYVAASIGILSGMGFNFLGNRYIVFQKRYIRK